MGILMEQLNKQLSEAMDTNSILHHAFDKLKAEAGKRPDFMYKEVPTPTQFPRTFILCLSFYSMIFALKCSEKTPV